MTNGLENPDPYSVNARLKLSPKKRLQLFLEHKGMCCLCHTPIKTGERWITEHIKPLWLDGTNDWENLAPAHEACATGKTQKEATERAKGRRIAEKHLGAHRPKTVMPGSRLSPWKKKFGGGAIRRTEK